MCVGGTRLGRTQEGLASADPTVLPLGEGPQQDPRGSLSTPRVQATGAGRPGCPGGMSLGLSWLTCHSELFRGAAP